jgi:DNA-binding response OmpR family regulator
MCAECDELRERVAYLEGELGLALEATKLARLKSTFGLSPYLAKFLLALYAAKGSARTVLQLMDAVPPQDHARERGQDIVAVWACHLRRKLGKDALENCYGVGYRLTPRGIALTASVIEPSVQHKEAA